ncbi:thioesterase II family protein [Streptomyces crystallinus]|uniref:Thioesterase domain-containing protein n=1 Tax=Streptomyces crystallinus TaxID=68191 RepID=A0ABN1FKE6_9ACTN
MRGEVQRVVLADRPEAVARLYCLPPSGCGPGSFLPWAAASPTWMEVCSISMPGRGGRSSEPSLTDTTHVVECLARIMDDDADQRPFAVFGHSVGALLAFETALHLRRHGGRLPVWLGLSSLAGPQGGAYAKNMLGLLAGGLGKISELLGRPIPPRVLDDARLMGALATPLLADFLLLAHHRYTPQPPLEVPLALYGGQGDTAVSTGQLAAWNELFTTPAPVRLFPGGHMYATADPGELVEQVAADLHRAVSAPVRIV